MILRTWQSEEMVYYCVVHPCGACLTMGYCRELRGGGVREYLAADLAMMRRTLRERHGLTHQPAIKIKSQEDVAVMLDGFNPYEENGNIPLTE